MNPSRLKYLLIFVLSTLLNSVSFALHIDEYNDVLNEVELFILVGFLSIHTFPVFPSKRLYSTEKNLDRYLHAHESFLRFEFGSEVQRSVAVSSFYLGGTFGSSIDIFFAPKWSIQVYTCFCSILFVIGHLFSTFSFNWNLLAIGRFFLGVGIGITGKFAHGSYNPNSLALHSKCITQKFRILYQLTAAAGILFGGFLRQYFLNSHILAWRVFSRIHASLGILVFLFTMFHNWIATFNPKRLPLTLRLLSLSKRIPIPTQPKASSNFNIAKAFERAIKILKIFIALYIFQQLSLINRYFSYIEEILGDLPNIYMLLGVANFAGTFLNVAIEALKGEENTRDHYLARIANAFDMEYICVISAAGCAISSLLLFIGFLKNIARMKSAAAFGFIFCFSFGFGPSPWMIIPKILPKSLQEAYDSFGSFFCWLCAFIITLISTRILPPFKEVPSLCLGSFYLFSILPLKLNEPLILSSIRTLIITLPLTRNLTINLPLTLGLVLPLNYTE